MIQKSSILILSATTLALSGCDRIGVGVGASTSEAQSQAQSQELTQSRSLGDRQERSSSVAFPFAALAVPALLGPDNEAARGLGEGLITARERLVGEGGELDELLNSGEPIARVALLGLLAAASQPGSGWPVPVIPRDLRRPVGSVEPSAYRHAENVSVAACWSSRALLRVHEALPRGSVLRSAEEVRERVREAYLGIPLQDLKEDLAACRQELLGAPITLNLTGVQGQQWAIGPLYVTRDARGATFTKAGLPWYGDGLIEGRKLELAATQAITSEMVMAAGSTRSSESRSGEETSGSVGVNK